jgi:hypothetical protein
MGKSRSTATAAQQPSERDQSWLDHEAALSASGQTAKAYASEAGLSLHTLYQARKRLRALGLMAPAPPQRKRSRRSSKGEPVSFSKIALAPSTADDRFRLELPGGLALVWPGGNVPESVAVLLERLAHFR